MYTASIILAEGILIIRTYALWGRSKKVLFFLLFLAGVGFVQMDVHVRAYLMNPIYF